MPRYNGTGPRGEGPMTGQAIGYCILKRDSENPSNIEGFTGIEGKPVKLSFKNKEEVIIMPRGDGTGPAGMGPMTGRAAGYCAGYPVPGYMNPIPGRGGFGVGRGGFPRGGGRGVGFRGVGYGVPYPYSYPDYPLPNYPVPASPYVPQSSPQDETNFLKDRISFLEEEIKTDKERIKELETQKQDTKKG